MGEIKFPRRIDVLSVSRVRKEINKHLGIMRSLILTTEIAEKNELLF